MKLSVIVPMHNEEGNVKRIAREIPRALNNIRSIEDYEIICINDGSSDNTLKRLQAIKNTQFRIFDHMNNYGLSAAIRSGIKKARFKYVGYIDADLQTNPKDFKKLVKYINQGYDAASGRRIKQKVGLLRKYTSALGHWSVKFFLKTHLHDTNCPLQIFSRKSVIRVFQYNNFHRFLTVLIEMQGYKVKEVPIKHYPRLKGEAYAGFGVWRRLKEGVRLLYVISWMRKNILQVRIKEVKK